MAGQPRASGRMLAVVIGLLLVAGACAAPSDAEIPVLRQLSRDEIVNVLATSGVGVFNDPSDAAPIRAVTEPASPLALTTWQVDHMSLDLKSGGSVAGSQLDEYGVLAGMPGDAPPFSYMVAGWASKYESAGAAKAREVMGDQDWEHPAGIVFPHLVLLLFVSDIGRDAETAENAARTPLLLAGPLPDTGPTLLPSVSYQANCPLTGWIDGVLNKIFNAVKVNASGNGILAVLGVIWNAAVDLAKTALKNLLSILAAQVVAAIKTTVTIVGVLSLVATLVAGFDVKVTHEGAKHFAHPGQPDQTGKFTATITSALGEWPGYILACAREIGLTLPDPNPLGKGITWKTLSTGDPVATVTGLDHEISNSGTAVLTYQTLREPPLDPPLKERGATFRVIPRIELFSDSDLEKFTDGLFFGGPAGAVMKALLGGLFTQTYKKIRAEALQIGDGGAHIKWHEEGPTPPPSEEPTDSPTDQPSQPPPSFDDDDDDDDDQRDDDPPCTSGSSCGRSNGDPHLTTVDGSSYDFMAAGEYVLIRSADGALEVQARQVPYPGDTEAPVTINSAIAARAGKQRVMIQIDPVTGVLAARVDGEPITLNSPESLALDGGAELENLLGVYYLTFSDGTMVMAIGQGDAGINVIVAPSSALGDAAVGLMGVVNPGGMDLPALPDGSVIPQPEDPHGEYVALYETFATAWRVTAENSLFDYEAGGSPDDYLIPGYPVEADLVTIDDILFEDWQEALDACSDVADEDLREQCAFDYYVTGDETFTVTYSVTDEVAVTGQPTLAEGVREVIGEAERIGGAALHDGTLFVSYETSDGQPVLSAVDTATGRLDGTVPVGRAGALAYAGSLWGVDLVAPTDQCSVSRVDPTSLEIVESIPVPCPPFGLPSQLAATAGAVWYAPLGETLTRIDAASGATATFDLPVSGGVLSATDSTVFYNDGGSFYSMPEETGTFTPAATVASFQAAVPGGDGVWVADGGQANLIVNGQTADSAPMPEGGRIVAADSGGVFVETSLVGSSELYRVSADGRPPTLMAKVTDLLTEDGTVALDYAPEDGSPLVLADGQLTRVWLIPSVAEPGSTSIAIQSATIPR